MFGWLRKDQRLAFIFIVLAGFAYNINCVEQVRYAAILYRHGDRTPVETFPTDPYQNESLWPVRFGQLTNTGKTQQYALGQWLRARYNHLLSEKFDPNEIYVRSTDVDRTLMSASTNLAGMYPPVQDTVWNANLLWQPIPVHTVPQQQDELLSMNKKCYKFEAEYFRMKTSRAYKKGLEKYKTLMFYLSQHAGFEVKDYYDIMSIYSVLKIEEHYNFSLPDWTHAVYPNMMVEPACYSFTTETATDLLARLKIGPFLKEVIGNMEKMMHFFNAQIPFHTVRYKDLDGKPPLKVNMYSAHDLNIGSVLNGLQLFDGRCPEYTATILFELVYDDAANIHFVKIFYRNSTEIVEPTQLAIPGCGFRCPLERFVTIYSDLIPADWDEECKVKFQFDTSLFGTIALGMAFFVFVILFYNYVFEYMFGTNRFVRLPQSSTSTMRLTPN